MTLPAQHTTFNTLDNWAIKPTPNQKKEKDRKEKVTGSWPGTCIQYTRLHLYHACSYLALPSIFRGGCTLPKDINVPFAACLFLYLVVPP